LIIGLLGYSVVERSRNVDYCVIDYCVIDYCVI